MNISVIIPCYNRAHTLARAIDSVLAQSSPVTEIVVIDDASTDRTEALVKAYPQINYIKLNQNMGVSHARNRGIEAAVSDWIALLDSDDAWAAEKIQKQVSAAKASPSIRMFHTDETWIRNGRRVNPMNKHAKPDGWAYEASLPMCSVSPSSVLFHRSLIEQCGKFDETLPACEDYDMWLRIFSRFPVKLVNESLVVKYGGHEDQLSRKYWGMDRFRIKALLKMLDSKTLSEQDRQLTADMLKRKCDIVIKGARKRGKSDRVAYYSSIVKNIADPGLI